MKRLLVVAVVIFLFGFGCCVVPVQAATPATLYVISVPNASVPSETTAAVYLKNSFKPEIGSLTFSLKFDQNALAIKKIDVREGGVNSLSLSSPIIIAYATTSGIPNGDTWLANITFISKSPAGSTTDLIIEPSVVDDLLIPPVDHLKEVTPQNGVITIGSASISPATQEPTPQPLVISNEDAPVSPTMTTPVTPTLTSTPTPTLTPTIASTSVQPSSPQVTSSPQATETSIHQETAVPVQTPSSDLTTPTTVPPVTQKSPGPGILIALSGIGVWMIVRINRKK